MCQSITGYGTVETQFSLVQSLNKLHMILLKLVHVSNSRVIYV